MMTKSACGERPTPGMYSIAFSGSPRVPATRSNSSPLRLRLVTSRGGASMVAVAPNSSAAASLEAAALCRRYVTDVSSPAVTSSSASIGAKFGAASLTLKLPGGTSVNRNVPALSVIALRVLAPSLATSVTTAPATSWFVSRAMALPSSCPVVGTGAGAAASSKT